MTFWKDKSFDQMTDAEWESLCDGCGQCCLHKLEDDETGEVHVTHVACRMLDLNNGRCKKYADRRRFVANCAVLTPARIDEFHWLPETCAYRLLAEGKDLYPWHPLISGQQGSVIEAGVSVVGRVVDERDAGDFEDHVGLLPRGAGEKDEKDDKG